MPTLPFRLSTSISANLDQLYYYKNLYHHRISQLRHKYLISNKQDSIYDQLCIEAAIFRSIDIQIHLWAALHQRIIQSYSLFH